MYAKPTAPRGIGGVLDDAFRLYRDAFTKSWLLALCGQVLVAVPIIIIQLQMKAVPPGNPQAILAVLKSPVIWLLYLAVVVVTLGFYNALVLQIDGVVNTEIESFGQSVATGFRLFPRMVLLGVLTVAALGIVAVVAAVLLSALGTTASPAVRTVLGTAFALIAIYVWGRLFLANIALVVENEGAFKSLGTSWTLIKNHWWRTATVYTVAVIISLVFYVVIGVFNGLIAAMLHGSAGIMITFGQLISVAGGTVLLPFLTAVLLAIYYDLKLRKEGTDLASRVNALAPQ